MGPNARRKDYNTRNRSEAEKVLYRATKNVELKITSPSEQNKSPKLVAKDDRCSARKVVQGRRVREV